MLNGKDNPEKIWNFLKSKGFNDYGAAGLMGNLHAESACSPTNLQNSHEKRLGMNDSEYTKAVDSGTYTNFVRDSAGYGIAQWTYWSRKQAMLNYAKQYKKSIGDMEMQLNFLLKELSQYGLLERLKKATSIYEATRIVMLEFEKPANQSESNVKVRAGYSEVYYKRFVNTLTAVDYIKKIVDKVGYDEPASVITALSKVQHPFVTDLWRKLYEVMK